MEPEAMTPKAPPLEMAATKWRSETQVIAPPMMARSLPRKAQPRLHIRSRRAFADRVCSILAIMGGPSWAGGPWIIHPGAHRHEVAGIAHAAIAHAASRP